MNVLMTALYAVLALFGSDFGSRTIVDRIRVGGSDVLVSKVVTQPALTRFECVRSVTGECYYTLFPRDCAPATAATARRCPSTPVAYFALADGDRHDIVTLPRFRLCVSTDAGVARPDCDQAEALAMR